MMSNHRPIFSGNLIAKNFKGYTFISNSKARDAT